MIDDQFLIIFIDESELFGKVVISNRVFEKILENVVFRQRVCLSQLWLHTDYKSESIKKKKKNNSYLFIIFFKNKQFY